MPDTTVWRGGDDAGDRRDAVPDPELDRLFELVSDRRRRALLSLLRESDEEQLWTTTLAVELARIESEGSGSHDDAEEIAVSLRHNHLPKLAEYGVIDADSSMTTLTYRGDETVEKLLRWIRARDDQRDESSPE